MNVNKFHTLPAIMTIAASAVVALSACSDILREPGREEYSSGEEASVTLSVELGDAVPLTRADITGDEANRVTSLWLGIYNSTTGDNTANYYLTNGKNGFKAGVMGHSSYTLTDIKTKSGKSYIVAVANPDQYKAITTSDNNPASLEELLQKASSWEMYKSIIITGTKVSGNYLDTDAPELNETRGLLMSGIYTDKSHNTPGSAHPDISETAYYIPAGNNSLTGSVHLRRLLSQVKFNIRAEGDIVEISPISFQVRNLPLNTWLHEHSGTDILNAGDALTPEYSNNPNYLPSLLFTSTAFDKTTTGGVTTYSFDFWQFENKRTGNDRCTDYYQREKEWGSNGEIPNPAANADYGTSGLFYSLTDFTNPSLNNFATYVDIPCVVKYKAPTTTGNAKPDGVTNPGNLLGAGAVRTANITYRIHLGYVGTNPDPKDFNLLRNSVYTYNVTVSNLHKVIVEAFREGDPHPGASGDVTDVSDSFFRLDAHYGVFNIYLSQDDLNSFSFRMVSYQSIVAHEVKGGGELGTFVAPTDDDSKYYTWVSLLPTTGREELALYPTDKTTLLHLGDFIPENGVATQTPGWYTVFVDEYAYETDANEADNNWKTYVNQPERTFWLNVAQKISSDGASAFYKAKYAGSQKSIQTYYTVDTDVATAIGVEHDNENFGFNIRWTDDVSTTGLLSDNGRLNVWNAIGTTTGWNNYVQRNVWQNVNPIANTNTAVTALISDELMGGGRRNVPSMAFLTAPTERLNINDHFLNSSKAAANLTYDPQSSQYVQAMFSCMNRNRDENGNGTIDPSELKWYLPTSGKYLRVILGRNSLATPVMSYSNTKLPNGAAQGENGLYHFISSDSKVIWVDEGLSSSFFTNAPYSVAPWQVRCVRNLGTNLTNFYVGTDNNKDGVAPAYQEYSGDQAPSGVAAIIRPHHYYGTSLRAPSETPLPLHTTNDDYNRVARYGFEVAYRGNVANSAGQTSTESAVTFSKDNPSGYGDYVASPTLCASLDTSTGRKGWRVPNQKELAIIGRIQGLVGIASRDYNSYLMSCTVEYWKGDGTIPTKIDLSASSEDQTLNGQRVCTLTQNSSSQIVATANKFNAINMLRCVRDLQPGEYPAYP